jgi:hypothetical protein
VRRLSCPACGRRVHFENSRCLGCGAEFGFEPAALAMRPVGEAPACGNRTSAAVCNWLLAPGDTGLLCRACRLTRTIPDLTTPGAGTRWAHVEQAKRRLVYALLRLGLGDVVDGLVFDLLGDPQARAGGPPSVVTGHAAGVITLNLEEADPGYRERTRQALDESYRTVLGHLRHESGHYLFGALVLPDADRLAAFRARFGDERADYGAALAAHYDRDPGCVDTVHYVTPYAASHPHEDWAETVSHLLHLLEVVESAASLEVTDAGHGDPYVDDDAATLVERFAPVSAALNELNRAMGLPDAYPFVLSRPVVAKLEFVLRALRRQPVAG